MNVLCLVAHPDDETMLCGGTLALLAARGANVHVACLTRGEGGELGEPPLTDREHLGEVREGELVCAVQKLGGKSLTFLGYVDPLVGPEDTLFAPEHDPVMLAGQIAGTVHQFEAQAVLTHGSNGEYGHPAHLLLNQLALAAVASFQKEHEASQGQAYPPPLLYTVSAAVPNHPYPRVVNADDSADLIPDLGQVMERKVAAALCHKTQHALFVRRRSKEWGRAISVPEAVLPVEGLHRVFGRPDDALSRLLMGPA